MGLRSQGPFPLSHHSHPMTSTTLPAVLLGTLLLMFVDGAAAQGNSATMGEPSLANDPCKRDVLKYQANIDLVRKSLGEAAAAELDARFMPRAEWDAVLLKQGYCGIARKLREQKLAR